MTRRISPLFLRLCLLLACGWVAISGAQAQQRPAEAGPASSRRCRWVRLAATRDTTFFELSDTLTVVPSSVGAENGRAVAYDPRTNRYRYVRAATRMPAFEPGQPDIQLPGGGEDSILVCYRVLPLRLAGPVFRRPLSLMDSVNFPRKPFGYEDFAVKEQILATPGINKTGNLARGISFGNAQNVFVNSALNLQLEGQLTDQIQLTAAISDQSVPFQPEGNTQQLQEFDRIFVTLTHPRWNLTAGDVVLRNKPDYFLRFYKNIQGAAIEANFGRPSARAGVGLTNSGNSTIPAQAAPATSATATTVLGKGRFATTTVAAGVAKGKFASIEITPIENVQGPYRLRGPNGEQFIIVLANSERVYLDGRLMTRGFDNDYIIDYNQAEVTFSPQHLITRNTRIRIDFEYSDFNYARSLTHVSHYQQASRLSVHANYYREADNPDNSPNLELTPAQRELLRNTGDNVSQATTPGADSAVYDRRQVQYNRNVIIDANGQPVPVFTYPPDSTRGVYTVRFTNIGPNQGDYILSPTAVNANGRVFQYVAPVNGIPQGSYQPIRLLPTPLQKQMLAGSASYRLDSTSTVFVDVATSQLDLNRFSPQSDQGRAFRVGYAVVDKPLRLPVLQGYKLRSTLDYEYTSRLFAPIDRYRDIEFDRNWSTTSTVLGNGTRRTPREDNIFNFSLGALKDANNLLSYRVSRRFRAGEVSGVQHWLEGARQLGQVEVRGALFLLNSEAGRRRSTWARGEATARYTQGRIIPGYAYRFDKNRVALPSGDSLSSANYYDEHNVFLQSRDSAQTKFRLDYSYRRDQTPNRELTSLQTRGRAQTWQGTFSSRLGKTQDLTVLATYRDLAARDSARQQTVLGKIDWNAALLQNTLRSELSYSVASDRELKRDYSFLPVPNGQGTHYYGGDAEPKNGREDKEEFFEAQTPDAQFRTHIKVFLPTDDYILAFSNRFSYRLTASAPARWREQAGWRSVAARFSTLTTVSLDRRTTDKSLSSRLNPFAFQTEDLFLLSLNKLLRNTLYFNRSNPIFGGEVTVQQTQQKVLLTQGTDIRNLASQSVLVRRTLAQSFTGRFTVTRTIRENESTYLSPRNFRLLLYEAAPEISYQPSNTLRFTGVYLHTSKQNTLAGPDEGARGVFDELGVETRVSQVGKRTVTAATRLVRVGFDGDLSSVVGLEILNALRPGNNLTWNVNAEQRLSNGLNLTLSYDGRKPNGLSPVHTGRMQVAVLF
ncbi:hypothetical protein HER32_05535 [Hymenobacter sp. BT18]|uniref:hypothetical protein n=1 Tax=Hymenobacter sp. BT18 TaxID=2835648 RepID=UPI00143E1D4F|nr:hypothetical protein [Hymenobacter sp. BT18]QIX60667.1 hypothetical protein HER32_05535 [Hymenobacter sp. BT18]